MSGNVATLAGGAAGAFIGSFFGMPGLGFSIGSGLAGMAFAPKPKGTSVDPGDLSFDTSAYGKFQPWGYGTYLVQGPVNFWSTDYIAHKKTEKVGGKGGGAGKQKVETITYTRSFAVYLADCTNGTPIVGVRRIWDAISGQMLYDVGSEADAATLIASQQFAKAVRVYTGALDQQPDPLIEAHEGWAPGWRGHAYVVFEDWDHGGSKQAPVLAIEVVAAGTETGYRRLSYQADSGVAFDTHLVAGVGRPVVLGLDEGIVRVGVLGKSIVYLFDTDALNFATDIRRSDENYPSSKPVGIFDGFTLTYQNLSTPIGDPDIQILPLNGGLAGDATSALPAGEFVGGAALSASGKQLLVFTAPTTATSGGAVIDKWYLLSVVDGVTRLDRSGTLETPASIYTFGFGNSTTYHFNCCMLEDDLAHLWVAHGGSNHVLLYEINAAGVLKEIGQAASGQSGFTYPSIFVQEGLAYSFFGGLGAIFTRIGSTAAQATVLPVLLGDLCARSGLEAGDYDTSLMPSTSARLSIDRLRPARDWLTELGNIYQFRMRNSGGALQFVPKGGSPVATIEQASLGLDVGEGIRPPITASRTQGIDLPRSVTVVYTDIDADYAPGQQYYVMRQYPQGQDIRLTVTAILSGAEALELAQIAAKEPHLERLSWTTSVGIEHLALEAGDVVDLPTGRAWVRDIQEQGDSVLRATFVAEAAAAYSGNGLPAPATTAPVRRIALAGPTRLELLDIPILQDADDGPGVYLAALGYLSGWSGAEVYRSIDGEVYEPLSSVITAAVVGTTTAALASGPTNIWDRANTLNVTLIDGSLSSASELNVLNGANAALVGAHGRWEIIQFETATLEADGSYTLSKLLRGRKGTDWAVGTHASGDTFVLLTTNTLGRVDKSVNDIGVTRNYKAVSFGNDIAQAATIEFANQGVGLKPYAPAHVTGLRNGAGDLTVKWIRRTRIGGEWRDYVDASLGEDSESYEVDIMNGSTVVRTIAATSSTATYTAADQTTDFGSTQSSITLRVYQLSADIGRGYKTEKTL